jgi:hypothetical protein
MRKIIQTLQQSLDFVDNTDRNKLQRIIRDLKTIQIRTEKKVKPQKDLNGCAIVFYGILIIIVSSIIYSIWTTIVG